MDIATVFEWFAEESKSIASRRQNQRSARSSLSWHRCGQTRRRNLLQRHRRPALTQRIPPVRWWIPAAHPACGPRMRRAPRGVQI
jgi:hypothetical protein